MNLLDVDTRVTCTECRAFTGKECQNPVAAGLKLTWGKAEIGPTLAAMRQRCFGFKAKPDRKAA